MFQIYPIHRAGKAYFIVIRPTKTIVISHSFNSCKTTKQRVISKGWFITDLKISVSPLLKIEGGGDERVRSTTLRLTRSCDKSTFKWRRK